jgi:ATP-dependent helicase IRC3
LQRFDEGIYRQAVVLPVGSGKTVIFSRLIEELPRPNTMPHATKTLVLAHREELLHQAYLHIAQTNPNLIIHIDHGRQRAISSKADIVIASVPTLGRTDSTRLDHYDPSQFKLIVIDEAHHAIAASYQKIFEKFKVLDMNSHIRMWGCSAHLERLDDVGFYPIFQEITYRKSLIEMMKQKWLSDIVAYHVTTTTNLDHIQQNHDDFDLENLADVLNNPERNLLIFNAWYDLAHQKGRKSTLIFAASVDHAQTIAELFNEKDISASCIYGSTPAKERQHLLQQFRAGKLPVLVNCGVFTEGTDIPCIDCVVMARPTRSKGLFIQMIGRGLRTYPDKKDCLILFLHDDYRCHDLVTVPSLIGLHPFFYMQGNSVLELQDQIDRVVSADDDQKDSSLIANIQSAEDLDKLASTKIDLLVESPSSDDVPEKTTDTEINEWSPFAWCYLNAESAALSIGKSYGSFIVFKTTQGSYNVIQLKIHQDNVSKKLSADDAKLTPIICDHFDAAIGAVDTFMIAQLRLYPRHLLRSAPWRKKPMTLAQFKWLSDYYSGDIEQFQSFNRGRASSLIMKVEICSYLKRLGKLPTALDGKMMLHSNSTHK